MAINAALTIKKELKTKEILLGGKRTLKKIDSIGKIYVAKDCPRDIREKIEKAAGKNKIDVVLLEFSKEELKDICKKPFNISVLSIISGKKLIEEKQEEQEEKEEKEEEKKEKKTKKKKEKKEKEEKKK